MAVFEAVWLGASFLRKELTRRIDRAKHEIARPHYYAQECDLSRFVVFFVILFLRDYYCVLGWNF